MFEELRKIPVLIHTGEAKAEAGLACLHPRAHGARKHWDLEREKGKNIAIHLFYNEGNKLRGQSRQFSGKICFYYELLIVCC